MGGQCQICGYEMTYMEFITDCYCAFHTKRQSRIGLMRWICFAIAEYRVWKAKLRMHQKGYSHQDYFACLGNVAPEIEDIKNSKDMDLLCKKLKRYKPKELINESH